MNLLDDLINPQDPFVKKNLELKGIDPNIPFLKNSLEKIKYKTDDPHPQERNPLANEDLNNNISVRFFPPYNRNCPNQLMGLIQFAYYVGSTSQASHKNLTKWLEIGSLVGESAAIFLSFPFIQELYCVDMKFQPAFYHRVQSDINIKRCKPIQKRSEVACLDFADGSLDVLYIDGDHSGEAALRDLTNWTIKVRPGGWVGVHDYVGD